MTARQRLVLLVERLQTGPPLVESARPWLWPEGDPVAVDDGRIRWLP